MVGQYLLPLQKFWNSNVAYPIECQRGRGVVSGNECAEVSDERGIEEVVVTAGSSIQERLGAAGSGTVLTAKEIQQIGATHASEALNRVAGVWVNRGSGQEHLTAVRSAVMTGSGACGEFSYLQDGIPSGPMVFATSTICLN